MRKSIEASQVKDDTLSGCMVGRYSIGGGTRGARGPWPPPPRFHSTIKSL